MPTPRKKSTEEEEYTPSHSAGVASTLKRNMTEGASPSTENTRRSKRLRPDADSAAPNGNGHAMAVDGAEQGPYVQEDPPKVDLSTLARHEEFWYEDGSVVLRIEDTLFRLNKTLLAAQSPMLKNIFSDASHPKKLFEVAPGCTLPCYAFDNEGLYVSDVEKLLRMMEDPLSIVQEVGENKQLDLLNPLARASYHLDFTSTYIWATDQLKEIWTDDFDNIETDDTKVYLQGAVDALQLSEDADIPQIRKAAFYDLLRHPDFALTEDNASLLDHAHYHSLTRAREYCTETWMDILLHPPNASPDCTAKNPPPKGGDSNTQCASQKGSSTSTRWLRMVRENKLAKYYINPVAGFDFLEIMNLAPRHGVMCDICQKGWRSEWRTKGEEFWVGLDAALRLVAEAEPEKQAEGA